MRGISRAASALFGAALCACPAAAPLPRLGELVIRAHDALRSGDTRGLFEVSRDVYRLEGLEFDSGLTLHTHGPETLSSFYLEDANQIVLAEAAPPGAPPLQMRALSTALFYAVRALPRPDTPIADRVALVNYTVLLLAAHELAHYLRAQYFDTRADVDHYANEAVCNHLAVAAVRRLAAADPDLAAGLERARGFYTQLLAEAPPAISAYPPPGRATAAWFNRHYDLLLRHEPGVYFLFQLRWWLEYLSAPGEPLERLVDREILEGARHYLAQVNPSRLAVRLRTVRSFAGRAPSEVLTLGPGGEVLVDADGLLVRRGDGVRRVYRTRALPYGEGYVSNYAAWPGGDRAYLFRWSQGRLEVYRIGLDDRTREARAMRIGTFPVADRVTTMSHDPDGTLYFLARGARETLLYRLDSALTVARRWPLRPPGHVDGPIDAATFEIGAFTVTGAGALVFYDPSSYALRQIDASGEVTTLAGSLRGHRDGSGATARVARASHLAAFEDGIYFLEQRPSGLALRRLTLERRWRSP